MTAASSLRESFQSPSARGWITRKASASVVMISLEDYEALEETAYLLRSPRNARRLLESIAELEGGGCTARELAEGTARQLADATGDLATGGGKPAG